MSKERLLIVDDEPAVCTVISRIAEPLGYRVRSLNESGKFLTAPKRSFAGGIRKQACSCPGISWRSSRSTG